MNINNFIIIKSLFIIGAQKENLPQFQILLTNRSS